MIDWSEQDMRVSRTELKKSHERLQALSIPLANLSKKQLKALPASDYFMAELMALADITSANARNRQTKRVGKLISEENRHELVKALFEAFFPDEQVAKMKAGAAGSISMMRARLSNSLNNTRPLSVIACTSYCGLSTPNICKTMS